MCVVKISIRVVRNDMYPKRLCGFVHSNLFNSSPSRERSKQHLCCITSETCTPIFSENKELLHIKFMLTCTANNRKAGWLCVNHDETRVAVWVAPHFLEALY